jgi:transcription antitermination factor NusG
MDKNLVAWYPMRVTYGRELKAKEFLDELGIECYVPMSMQTKVVDDKEVRLLLPAVDNLIFVHSNMSELNELKQHHELLASLRYMINKTLVGNIVRNEILTVPDHQMDTFIKLTKQTDIDVSYLHYEDYIAKPGRRVVITEGPFAGVEGKIKRIQNNKRVVVELNGVLAIALTYIPTKMVKYVQDELTVIPANQTSLICKNS